MDNIIWTALPLPLVLGVIIKMLMGGLWYSPLLFGKRWMKLTGFTAEDMETDEAKKASKVGLMGASAAAIVVTYIIGVVIQSLNIESAGATLAIMALFFVGFTSPVLLSRHLWEKRHWGLLPIDASYEWISYTLIGLLYTWL